MKLNHMVHVLTTVICTITTGCATSKGYVGTERPSNELAVIRGDQITKKQWLLPDWVTEAINIQKVNGRTAGGFYMNWSKEVKLLPGKNEIEVRYFNERQLSGEIPSIEKLIFMIIIEATSRHDIQKLTLTAEAGHEYIVRFNSANWEKHAIPMWIEDTATGDVVAGAKPEPNIPKTQQALEQAHGVAGEPATATQGPP